MALVQPHVSCLLGSRLPRQWPTEEESGGHAHGQGGGGDGGLNSQLETRMLEVRVDKIFSCHPAEAEKVYIGYVTTYKNLNMTTEVLYIIIYKHPFT
jgi:hypothetical protein